MKILDRYIARTIFGTIMMTLLVLLGLNGLFQFVDELGRVGRGSYGAFDALLYILLSTPLDLEDFFPPACLLGALLGLGSLASSSELVVMRAAGISKVRIAVSVLIVALSLTGVTMAISEWVAPKAELYGKQLRTQAIEGGSVIRTGARGVWARDESTFAHIGLVIDDRQLEGLTLYDFDDGQKLVQVLYAPRAEFHGDHWLLSPIRRSVIQDERIVVTQEEAFRWDTSVTPETLNLVSVKPKAMPISGLYEDAQYLEESNLDSGKYQLALWRKLLTPLTISVMMFLALSFIFGPLRSGSMGARLMLGVLTGFGYFLLGEMFGPLSLVYKLPPVLAAMMPPVVFAGLSIWMLRRGQ